MGNATSIFNLMRNIGGSVGIAVMTTLLARRQQFHQSRLIEHIRPGQPQVSAMLHQFTRFFVLRGSDPVTASRRAYGAMLAQLQQHAAMLSFVEAFKIMGVVFLIMIPTRGPAQRPEEAWRIQPVSAIESQRGRDSPGVVARLMQRVVGLKKTFSKAHRWIKAL